MITLLCAPRMKQTVTKEVLEFCNSFMHVEGGIVQELFLPLFFCNMKKKHLTQEVLNIAFCIFEDLLKLCSQPFSPGVNKLAACSRALTLDF